MAVVSLSKGTFTQVAIPAKSLVHFRGGIAEVAATATPAAGDWVTFTPGDMFVAESAFYARGVGSVVTLAVGGGVAPPVVTFTAQPTASPGTIRVGEIVNLTLGTLSNGGAITGVLMQGGVDRTAQINDGTWSPSASGNATWQTFGPGGSPASNVVTITVQEAEVPAPVFNPATAAWYMDGTSQITGTAAAVDSVINQGNGGYNLAPSGAGADVAKGAQGFTFADGKLLQVASLTTSGLAGVFMIVRLTSTDYGSGVASFLEANPTGGTIVLRNNNGTLQAIYNDGSARTTTIGTITHGVPFTVGIEIDNDLNRVRFLLPDGSITSVTPAGVPLVNFVTIRTGQRLIGTIHRQAVYTKTPGGTFAKTFEEVAAEFRGSGPVPAGTTDLVMARGQSLSLGPNIGAQAAPDARLWRTVLSSNPGALMLGGLKRSDGVSIVNVANPLKVGYDTATPASGFVPLNVQTSVPEGVIIANGMVRDGLSANVAFQFHDLGGISVEQMDDDPATGTGTDGAILASYQNAEYWLSEAKRINANVRVPRIVWNQGEADVNKAPGAWLAAFRLTYGDMVAQAKRITGQETDPKLFIWQTGGYMYGTATNSHAVKLDQINAASEFGGVLIGPLHAYPIDNSDGKGVHLTALGYLTAYETAVWSMVEEAAGRQWSINPPTASRSGGTITLTFALRGDETLTSEAGKYAAYGGDPANLGFEAIGGGAITGATIGSNTVTLVTTGTVTGIKYAMQATATDYRTLTVDNVGYAAHRGILRTTLTKSVTLGGQALTLKRWVPGFNFTI